MSETRVQTVLLGVGCFLLAVVAGLLGADYRLAVSVKPRPFSVQIPEYDLHTELAKIAKDGGRVHWIHDSGPTANGSEKSYRVIGE